MAGSVGGFAAEVGEVEGVVDAAVVVGGEIAGLEGDASGLSSAPHPATTIDAANGTTNSAAAAFLTG